MRLIYRAKVRTFGYGILYLRCTANEHGLLTYHTPGNIRNLADMGIDQQEFPASVAEGGPNEQIAQTIRKALTAQRFPDRPSSGNKIVYEWIEPEPE